MRLNRLAPWLVVSTLVLGCGEDEAGSEAHRDGRDDDRRGHGRGRGKDH